MHKQQNVKKNSNKIDITLTAILLLTVILFVSILFVGTMLLQTLQFYKSSRDEYAKLRKIELDVSSDIEDTSSNGYNELILINPDYIGWLSISGTKIDYPVVRGKDNKKYLTTSFIGQYNPNGAIFMDYRCSGEYMPHIIIYGHNSKQGEMFGDLKKFVDEKYLSEDSVISLNFNGYTEKYKIFSARKTDIFDPAYRLDFNIHENFENFIERCNAPAGTQKIITLSTCISGLDKNERLIVQGYLSP